MEPVTHILTGACLARTGLNRRAAYTTLAMAVAAEFPDIDTLWGMRGPVASFEHHRGITQTFLGIPFEAAIIVAGIYGLHRWRIARAARIPASVHSSASVTRKPLTAAAVRWGLLYGFALLALLSHLLLDYTNNYGLRPFFPFNPRWYAASITFIFDPLMFALLLAALVLPGIFRLVSSEVGARRQPFAARGWSVAALLGVCGLWGLRAVEHARAVDLAMAQSVETHPGVDLQGETPAAGAPAVEPPAIYFQPQRTLASPDPLSPFRWYTVSDFGPFYQSATVNVTNSAVDPAQYKEPKLNPSPALLAAEASPLGRAYLDWSPMPFIDMERGARPDGSSATQIGQSVVTFRDPRFMGESSLLHFSRRTPLTGTVELDAGNHVVRQTMDGKVQR